MRIGVGLSIPELSTRGGRFSPASLFTGGVQGAWYAPDDFSTLFQDSAGTTPVTAVEQPVGLMLDKSQGLVIGPELITNGGPFTTTTGWTAGNNAVLSATGGRLRVTNNVTDYGQAGISFTTVANTWYAVTFNGFVGTSGFFRLTVGSSIGSPGILGENFSADTGTITRYFLATGTTTWVTAQCNTTNDTAYVELGSMSVKSIPGNHASQATAASRPVLRARYNQLTYSEQFDNAAWIKGATQTTTNTTATTAPDGTTTADLFKDNSSGGTGSLVVYQNITLVSNQTCTFSVYLKNASLTQYAALRTFGFDASANGYTYVDIVNGTIVSTASQHISSVQNVGNGWYRFQITLTLGADNAGSFAVYPSQDGTTTTVDLDGTSGLYIWGADLRTGSSAGTYQRIAAATDYATAGFLPYLALDGTDDSLATGSINFSATDKMTVTAGIKDNGAAAQWGTIAELSVQTNANNGSFALYSWWSANWNNGFALNTGGSYGYRTTPVSSNFSNTNVITAQFAGNGNIATGILATINSVTPTLNNNGSIGTGNFGNYPLFIGRRNNASLPFNGRIYGLIVAGKTLSASELSATESWMAAKTGVTL